MSDKIKETLSDIGEESMPERAARRVREALGRDTLTDKAQHLYNDAKQGLANANADIQDRISNLGEETLAEKAARKVREALGRETMSDKAQKKYNEAKEYLKQAKDTDFSQFPEKAQYLKDRLSVLGQQAMDSAKGKLDELNDVIEPSLWEKVKLKLGMKHEPIATEKAQLIAQHLKDQASSGAAELAADKLADLRNSRIASSFNRFLSKIGSSPIHAVNTANEWIGLDPETRAQRRREKAISKEAHEALDELLERLMDQVDNDPSNVESIQISVKAEEKHTSLLQGIKEKVLGSSASGEEEDIDTVNPSEGYEGMKNKIEDMVENVKQKMRANEKAAEKEESYVDMAQRKIREATSAGKESLSHIGEESLAEKASRKMRETLGRDTVSDKLHHKLDDVKDSLSGDTAPSLKERIGDMVDSAKDKLHLKSGESSTEFASRKYEDMKDSLSSLGHETLAERAARKVREVLGRETLADKAHRQMEEAREMYLNAIDNMPGVDDVKEKLASFGSESLTEKAARKVREALGQDTLADKAHRKLAEARELLDSVNAASAKEKLNEAKESISNIDLENIKEKVGNAYEAAKEKIPSSSDIKESISSIGSESLAEKTGRKVREALGRDTMTDKLHHKVADIKDTLSPASESISEKLSNAKDSLADKVSSLGEETLSERAARKVKESQAVKGRQVSIAAQTLFLFSSGLAKNSILVSYLRIAPAHSWLRRVTYGSIGLVTALIFIFLIVLWTQCRPMSAYWSLTGGDSCSAEGPSVLSQAITTVVTDLLVCAIPLPTLFKLKLPLSQRIALIVVFSLGLVVVFAASMRAYWTHYVTDETYDVTWEGFYLWIWTAVEANLGVICGSVPALRPLFRSIFRSKSSSYYNKTGSHAYPPGTAQGGVVTVITSPKKASRTWTDSLQRGSKGVRIQDDHIDIEAGTFSGGKRHKDTDSGTSTLEMDTWPSREQPRSWPSGS